MNRALFSLVLCAAPAFAAVSGTVINRTTGSPQAGVEVEFIKVDQGGMQVAGQAKSDAKGAFTIDQAPGQTSMIRATLDGVSYTHVLQPGQPTTGLSVDVYGASTQQDAAKVSKHMLMFGPSGSEMSVQETFLISNSGKTTWNDPNGTVRFYLPGAAKGKADVSVTPPGGLPLSGSMVKTSKADVYAVQFPVRPGDSRIDVSYAVPYAEGSTYEGKIPTQDENTYLIAPSGVTLQGENLNDLGSEPQTQAHIYGLTGTAYKVQLTGAAAPPAETAGSGGQDGAPQIEAMMPRVIQKAPLILALALAILAIGFVMLYRAPGNSGKETNERGRR
jgi:hypothetical protein